MEEEVKDIIVLYVIGSGEKKFDKIAKKTNLEKDDLNTHLEKLEKRGLINVEQKKGLLGPKIELKLTEKGQKELEERKHEFEQDWNKMKDLYNKGDKQQLQQVMEEDKKWFPAMMMFGIVDMMMFMTMFSFMGMAMSSFIPASDMPQGMEGAADGETGSDAGADAGDGGGGMGDGGGFDIDIGF